MKIVYPQFMDLLVLDVNNLFYLFISNIILWYEKYENYVKISNTIHMSYIQKETINYQGWDKFNKIKTIIFVLMNSMITI